MKPDPLRGIAASLLALFAATAFAQGGAGEGGGKKITGWHIVRPGENLIQITTKYMGNPALWRDNWKLNPQIQNPHVIMPGTRLRVELDFETAPPVARLKAISGQVEERPVPIPWNEAQVEDLLVERDGLRTHRNSSTELEFRDGTNLILSEESLVFVRSSRRATPGPKQRSVEIFEGQAEVQALRPDAPRTDVEILVGTARATATQSEDGLAQARARKAEDGSAQLMIYEGAGEVEAAGESVAVPKGMGTAVPENAPPAPPEELLSAPVTLEPAAGSEWSFGNPWFSWEPVADARAHTIEICSDPACGQLVQRAPNVADSRWRPELLPAADLYWRVTAVAQSGLDGYPSEPVPFKILFSGADASPPIGQVAVSGRSVSNGGVTYFETGARIEASMSDEETGLDRWAAMVDGRELAEDELAGPWQTGTHVAKAVGVDRSGNRGESDSVSFEVDADGPRVEVRLGGADLLEEKLGTGSVPKKWCKRRNKWIRRYSRRSPGRFSVWTLIAAGSDNSPIASSYHADRVLKRSQQADVRADIDGDNPGVLLLVAGRPSLERRRLTPEEGGDESLCGQAGVRAPGYDEYALLWIGARDELSGEVTSMSVDTRSRPAREAEGPAEIFLAIETEDILGNRRQVDVVLEPSDRAD